MAMESEFNLPRRIAPKNCALILCAKNLVCAKNRDALQIGKKSLTGGEALGAVRHYIDLNPVRAGLVEASCLEQYVDSSFARL